MRDLHRNAGFGADIEQFIERGIEADILVADMADVATAARPGCAGQCEHLVMIRIDAGIIFEAGRQAE